MQIMNFTAPTAKPTWEKTEEGWLRCKARVLAERIMPYHWKELDVEGVVLPEVVNMIVKGEEMARPETLRSLEGVPVVAGKHQWLGENVNRYAVGSVAGSARINPPYLECDLLLTDPETIAAVERGDLPEISAAYQAEPIFENGVFNEQVYDALQTQLKFNHICLLPAGLGRAGQDVRILNRRKEKTMSQSQAFQNGVAKARAEIAEKMARFNRVMNGEDDPDRYMNAGPTRQRINFNADPKEAGAAALRQIMNSRRPTQEADTPADVRRMMNAARPASQAFTAAVRTKRISDLHKLGLMNSNEAMEQVQEMLRRQAMRPDYKPMVTAYDLLKPTRPQRPLSHEEKMQRIFGKDYKPKS